MSHLASKSRVWTMQEPKCEEEKMRRMSFGVTGRLLLLPVFGLGVLARSSHAAPPTVAVDLGTLGGSQSSLPW
jgi:hypothetical protein